MACAAGDPFIIEMSQLFGLVSLGHPVSSSRRTLGCRLGQTQAQGEACQWPEVSQGPLLVR